MASWIKVSFYIRRSRLLKNGHSTVYTRLSVNGIKKEFTTEYQVDPKLWSGQGGSVKGRDKESRSINKGLDSIRQRLYQIVNDLRLSGEDITLETVYHEYKGVDTNIPTLLEFFDQHNQLLKERVGVDRALGTYKRYCTTRKLVAEYLSVSLKKKDIRLKDFKTSDVRAFEHHLKTYRSNSHNTTTKYLKNLKKVMNLALENGFIKKNPFMGIRFKIVEVYKDFLTEKELDLIWEKDFEIPRINAIKDIFLFCCYTGLAYIDVKKLKKDNLHFGDDLKPWIKYYRQKSNVQASIPILPRAEAILRKYTKDPICLKRGLLLPVLSNQRMNSYLKEIADLCGIKKNLTTHMARHTFATTVTLAEGISLEVVSKMLGHSKLATTQVYAKMVDDRIAREMEKIGF